MLSFLLIFFQDMRERQVHWFLIPIIGILSGILFYNETLPELFLASFGLNLCFVAILLLVVFLYSKLKLKTNILNAIGIGDILLFLALSVSFSTISFVILFLGALIFSLLLHWFSTSDSRSSITVPLAGYMSLFFSITYIVQWSGLSVNLYAF